MCPRSYYHSGFVATHALGHMIYGYTLLVPMDQRVFNKLSKEHKAISHCGDSFTAVTIYCVIRYGMCYLLHAFLCITLHTGSN